MDLYLSNMFMKTLLPSWNFSFVESLANMNIQGPYSTAITFVTWIEKWDVVPVARFGAYKGPKILQIGEF